MTEEKRDEKFDEKLLNVNEAAAFLGISRATLWRYGKEIGCFRIGNRRLFHRKHLTEFLEKNETTLVGNAARGE